MNRIISGLCGVLAALFAVGIFLGTMRAWWEDGLPASDVTYGLIVAGVLTVIAFVLLYGTFAGNGPNFAISALLTGARPPEERSPGDVVVTFHTYCGFLVYVQQAAWRFALPADEARRVLWKMHRSNLIWGCFAYGALFIPAISFFNYRAQLRSIAQQEEALPKS